MPLLLYPFVILSQGSRTSFSVFLPVLFFVKAFIKYI